ncbi:MAG: hypothetical protein AAF065_00775 [Verrucomicrobiota bacterium]
MKEKILYFLHNDYLEISIELGIPGILGMSAIFVILLAATGRLLFKKENNSTGGIPPALAAFLPLLVLATVALFSAPLFFTGHQFVFLSCLGIIFSGAGWLERYQISVNLSWRPARLLALISTVFVLLGFLLFGSRVIAEIRADRIFYQNFFPALNDGDIQEAENVARSALSRYPTLLFARVKLAEILAMQGEHKEALFHSLQYYSIQPHVYRNNWVIGSALVNLEYYEDAIEVYARILEITPDDRKAAILAAKLSQKVNDPGRAERFLANYSEAIQHAESDIFLERAQLTTDASDHERAEQIIQEGLIHHPEDRNLINQLNALSSDALKRSTN